MGKKCRHCKKLDQTCSAARQYFRYPLFTILWADSADDKAVPFFLIFPRKIDLLSALSVKVYFLGKIRNNGTTLSSAEIVIQYSKLKMLKTIANVIPNYFLFFFFFRQNKACYFCDPSAEHET